MGDFASFALIQLYYLNEISGFFSICTFFLFSGPCGGTTRKTASNAKSIPTTSTSYPAFHSVQSEYLKSTVHIEPFYRYRVHSDA